MAEFAENTVNLVGTFDADVMSSAKLALQTDDWAEHLVCSRCARLTAHAAQNLSGLC